MKRLLLVFALLALCTGMASAVTLTTFGTFGFTPLGNVYAGTTAGNDISTATFFTIPVLQSVNSINDTYLGNPNQFSPTPPKNSQMVFGEAPVFSTTRIDLFDPFPTGVFLTWTNACPINSTPAGCTNSTYTFKIDSRTITRGTQDATAYYVGQFFDSSNALGPASGTGLISSLSMAFTQSGGNTGSINYSASFSVPNEMPPTVPEPGTFLLLGSALIVIGAFKFRKA